MKWMWMVLVATHGGAVVGSLIGGDIDTARLVERIGSLGLAVALLLMQLTVDNHQRTIALQRKLIARLKLSAGSTTGWAK